MRQNDEASLPYYRTLRLPQDHHFRNLAIAALVAGALPVGMGSSDELWLWELLGTSTATEIARLCAPLAFGLGLLLLARWPWGTRLGQGVAALFLLVAAIGVFSESQLAYGELFAGFMAFVGRQPAVIVLGFSLLAVGAELRVEEGLQRLSTWLLIVGSALLALLYALPQRGSPFIVELAIPAARLLSQGKLREIVALLMWWACALVPLGIAIWGLIAASRRGPVGILSSVARYGLVGLAILLSYQILMRGQGFAAMALHLRAALFLGVTVGVASRALEAILLHLLADPLPPGQERSDLTRDLTLRERLRDLCARIPEGNTKPHAWLRDGPGGWLHPVLTHLMTRRVATLTQELFVEVRDPRWLQRDAAYELLARLGAGDPRPEPRPWALRVLKVPLLTEALVALGLLVAVLPYAWAAFHPPPDLRWPLRQATPDEEALFTQHIPDYLWAVGRRKADRLVGASGMESVVEERAARQDLLARAREIDPALAGHLERLEGVVETTDLAGERWVDAILPLNDRIRELGLPFYLDPQVYQVGPPEKRLRVFFLVAYRVDGVQRFTWEGRGLAALRVHRADELGAVGEWLGYVRWGEPFAKVLVQEIEEHVATKLDALATGQRCGLDDLAAILPPELWAAARKDPGRLGDVDSLREERIDLACGRVVLGALAQRGVDPSADRAKARSLLVELHVEATTRHELQHQVDGPELRVSPEVLAAIPLADDRSLARIAGEASAYLTEMATSDPVMSAWVLGQLTGFVLRGSTDYRYRFAAAVALAEIAGEPVIDDEDHPRLEALARLWDGLAALPPADRGPWLAERARVAREVLLGDAPARPALVEDTTPVVPSDR